MTSADAQPSEPVTSRHRTPRGVMISVALAIVVLIAFVVVAVTMASHSSEKLGNQPSEQLVSYPPSRQRTPAQVTLKRLGGGPAVVVGGATGKPLVVNFFASWCPACQRELGAIASVARSGRVRLVGVDTDDDSPTEALTLLRRAHANYPVGIGGGALAEDYGTGNLPTTAFLDGKGRVVAIALGALTRSELARWVSDLVAGRPLSS